MNFRSLQGEDVVSSAVVFPHFLSLFPSRPTEETRREARKTRAEELRESFLIIFIIQVLMVPVLRSDCKHMILSWSDFILFTAIF